MPPPSPTRRGAAAGDRRNVSRVDSGRSHGWLVRVQRDGRIHQRFFGDGKHGSREAALDAARAWRDEQRQRLGPTSYGDAAHLHTHEARERNRRSVSRTGVTGIGFQVREFRNERVPYVTAYWLDEGGRRRPTSFSVQENGLVDALRLAAEVRARTADWHGADPKTAVEIARDVTGPVRRLITEAGFDPADYARSAAERREIERAESQARRAERATAQKAEREARAASKLDRAVERGAATLQKCGVEEPDTDLLRRIIRAMGPSAYRADREKVACSDPKERARVRRGFLRRTLGVSRENDEGAVEAVCEQMRPAGAHKLRSAFYYLLTVRHGREDVYAD